MASGFNLTAQLQLQAPTNTKQVATQIQSGLNNITVPVQIVADPRALGGLNSQLKTTQKTALATGKNMAFLNRNIAEAARRFSVITVATGSFIALARGIKNSVKAAVEFERELVKISQVTGKSTGQLRSLTAEVTRLSTSLGVGNQSLLETARVLSQAGLSATKTKQAMEVLANTTLAPSFDNIIDTTEGAIAILNQFGREAKKTGQDIRFLEQSLDAINQVSKNFAVESADLITAIRRTGGVFQAAGGNLNELIALFTSVRQTTRESAETIATGFRTIFTRLQRSETVDALNELGIALTDAEGKFIGPLKAIEALSIGLAGLDPKDIRFNEIVEQLGGFRQIGKVIPLIKQYNVAQQALAVANNAAGSTAADAQTAQQSLAVQFQKVTEQFDALIRKFSDSETFRGLAKTVIDLATAFLKFAESLETVLPQLTALAAIKIGRNIAPGILGLIGGGGGAARRNMGGRIHGFSGGGWVPGTGSRDTVPAMLTPGEFVIKKSSAAKLGPDTLSGMNAKGYASGGKVSSFRNAYGPKSPRVGSFNKPVAGEIAPGSDTQFATVSSKAGDAKNAVLQVVRAGDKTPNNAVDAGGAFLQPVGIERNLRADIPGQDLKADLKAKIVSKYKPAAGQADPKGYISNAVDALPASSLDVPVMIQSGGFSAAQSEKFKSEMAKGIGDGVAKAVPAGMEGQFKRGKFDTALQSANIEQIEGNIFESFLTGLSDKPFGEAKVNSNDNWDFAGGVGDSLGALFGIDGGVAADAKRTFSDDSISSIVKKAGTQFKEQQGDKLAKALALELKPEKEPDKKDTSRTRIAKAKKQAAARKNMGGSISGSGDSVPALLTPGEFVVKKSAAQSIGYSNLASMNKTGISRFNKGGAVGIQTFADGGSVQSGDFGLTSMKDLALVNAAAKKNADAFNAITSELERMNLDPDAQRAALVKFARNVDSVADEAELLDQAMLAAHRDITSAGPTSVRTGKKPSGAAGAGGGDDSNKGHLSMMSGDAMAKLDSITDRLGSEFENSIGETRAGQKAQAAFRKAINDGIPPLLALKAAREAGKQHEEELAAEAEALAEARRNGTMSEEDLIKANLDLMKRTQSADRGGSKGGGPPKGPKVPKGPTKDFKKIEESSRALSDTFGKAGQTLNGLSTAAVGAMFIMGTLTESSNELSEEQKKIAQAGNNAVAMHVAMATQVASLVLETASAVLAARANSAAKAAEAASAELTGTANGMLAGSAQAAAQSLNQLSGAATGEAVSDAAGDIDIDAGGKKGKGGMSKANMAMAAFTAGMVVTTAVTGYFAKKTAEAVAALDIMIEKANEAGDAELEKIGQSGQVASEDKFVKARTDAATGEFDKGIESSVGSFNKTLLGVAGTVGAVGAAAAVAFTGVAASVGGFAMGLVGAAAAVQAFPIVGQIVGAVLIGVAAAAAAMAVAFAWAGKSAEDEAKKQASLRALTEKASRGFAITTFRAQSAVANFDDAVQSAADANLSAAAQLQVLAGGIGALQTTVEQGSTRLSQATSDRVELERALQNQGLLSDTGRVQDADASEDDKDRLGQLKELRKQEEEARNSQNKLIQKLAAQEGALRQKINSTLSGTLNEIASVDPSALVGFTGTDAAGVSSLSGLEDPATDSGKKIIAMNQAIAKATQEFEKLVFDRFQLKIDAAAESLNFDYVNALEKEREATIKQATAERVNNENKIAVSIQKAELSRLTELIVMRKQRDAIEKNNQAMRAFNNVLLGATATARNFAAIDDIGGIEGGFGAVEIDASPLDQPLQQLSKDLLKQTVGRASINTAETGGPAFPGADDIGKRILNAKGLIDAIPDVFEGFKTTFQQGLPVSAKDLFDKLESAAGIAAGTLAGTPVGDIIQGQITDILKDAKGKPITADQYQQIIDNIEETLDADLETIKRAIEIQNQFLDKMNQVNQAVVAQQQKLAEANARVIDVQERAADRMAQATGKPRNSADKEFAREQAAQARLGVAGRFGAQAGNVDATLQAALDARGAVDAARNAERDEAGTFRKGGPELTGNDGLVRLNKDANESAQAFKNAKAELERMADQSARASDIMAEIAEEQKKRKQLQQVGENIAFGSDDQRKDIAMGFNNVMQAFQQGGIQNANDEERARILKTLDSVADVGIGPVDPATGKKKTGREIKAQFQADEILRLTGNQELANASFDQAMAGTKEEQLLGELARVGEEEVKAAQALAKLEDQELTLLQTIADNTAAAFGKNVEDAINAEAPKPGGKKQEERDKITAELEQKRAAVLEALNTSQINLKTSQENLIQANKDLQAAIEGRQEEEKPEVKAKKEADAKAKFEKSKASQQLQQAKFTAGKFTESKDQADNWWNENSLFYGAAQMGSQGLTEAETENAIERDNSVNSMTVENLRKGGGGMNVSGMNADGAMNSLEDSVMALSKGAFGQIAEAGRSQGMDEAAIAKMQADAFKGLVGELGGGANETKSLDQLGTVFGAHLNEYASKMEAAIIKGLSSNQDLDNMAPADHNSRGGLIYRSLGGSIFKPRGTDTVPAMLTPGEFVLRKSAVDRIGMSALTAMNSGDTSAVYKAKGGGVGYKRSMNRNRISGFHRGGMVGRGDVSYASQAQASGAVLQLDPANIQAVLNEFNANFGSHIDNMIGNLSTFAEAATNLASSIAGGMDVRIVMSGDLTTAVKLDGDQTEHLKNAIADSILPQIAENVAGTIENKIRELKDNP